MKLRLAKICDAESLALLHSDCCSRQVGGFFAKLGTQFLVIYYRIFINEPHSVILVAEDEALGIIGFSSGTTRAEEHIETIRRHRWRLGIATIWPLLRNPLLGREIWLRWKSLKTIDEATEYIISKGVRGEYWAWRPNTTAPAGAVVLRRSWSRLVKAMGYNVYRFELDSANSDVEMFKTAFKSRVIFEKTLPDGRKRLILEEEL